MASSCGGAGARTNAYVLLILSLLLFYCTNIAMIGHVPPSVTQVRVSGALLVNATESSLAGESALEQLSIAPGSGASSYDGDAAKINEAADSVSAAEEKWFVVELLRSALSCPLASALPSRYTSLSCEERNHTYVDPSLLDKLQWRTRSDWPVWSQWLQEADAALKNEDKMCNAVGHGRRSDLRRWIASRFQRSLKALRDGDQDHIIGSNWFERAQSPPFLFQTVEHVQYNEHANRSGCDCSNARANAAPRLHKHFHSGDHSRYHRRLRRLALLYFHFYHAWLDEHAPVLSYLHVSKSGGTTMCSSLRKLSQAQDAAPGVCLAKSSQNEVGNCWSSHLQDGPRWSIKGVDSSQSAFSALFQDRGPRMRDSCNYRAEYLSSQTQSPEEGMFLQRDGSGRGSGTREEFPVSFTMNEGYEIGGEEKPLSKLKCVDHQLNMMVLRHPVDRVISMLHATGVRNLEDFDDSVLQELDRECAENLKARTGATRNYLTRLLLGGAAFRYLYPRNQPENSAPDRTHSRTQQEEHDERHRELSRRYSPFTLIDLARRVLDGYDVIVLLQHFNSRAMRHTMKLATGVELERKLADGRRRRQKKLKTVGGCIPRNVEGHEEGSAVIRHWLDFDLPLYQYGVELALQDYIFWSLVLPYTVIEGKLSPEDLFLSNRCVDVDVMPQPSECQRACGQASFPGVDSWAFYSHTGSCGYLCRGS